jgi:hypothetical protein
VGVQQSHRTVLTVPGPPGTYPDGSFVEQQVTIDPKLVTVQGGIVSLVNSAFFKDKFALI